MTGLGIKSLVTRLSVSDTGQRRRGLSTWMPGAFATSSTGVCRRPRNLPWRWISTKGYDRFPLNQEIKLSLFLTWKWKWMHLDSGSPKPSSFSFGGSGWRLLPHSARGAADQEDHQGCQSGLLRRSPRAVCPGSGEDQCPERERTDKRWLWYEWQLFFKRHIYQF